MQLNKVSILLFVFFSFCGIFISKCLFVKEFLIFIFISSFSFIKLKLLSEINLFRELNISSMFSNNKKYLSIFFNSSKFLYKIYSFKDNDLSSKILKHSISLLYDNFKRNFFSSI